MTPPIDSEFLAASREAAFRAGQVLLEWRGKFQVREKAKHDYVTEADFAAQRTIRTYLSERFPDHGFLGEEQDQPRQRPSIREIPWTWCVDPLDGTTNYVHDFPYYCVSIALLKSGVPIVATVFNPVTNECFHASQGGGAFLNDQAIACSPTQHLHQALLAASLPANVTPDAAEVRRFLTVMCASQSVRRMGAAALNLAHLAAGRLDGYWATTVQPWDVAAGALLVQEAGGIICSFDGGPLRLDRPAFVAAATRPLLDELKSHW